MAAPFEGWGQGRAWPLLTGERGHYELAAGHDTKPFLRAMESFASALVFCPNRRGMVGISPEVYMYCGRPTGSAMPLMWAHAEYIKLLRSVRDGKVSDLIVEVANGIFARARTVNCSKSGSLPGRCGASNAAMCFASKRRLLSGCTGRATNGRP